jgi:hypothetical protein
MRTQRFCCSHGPVGRPLAVVRILTTGQWLQGKERTR